MIDKDIEEKIGILIDINRDRTLLYDGDWCSICPGEVWDYEELRACLVRTILGERKQRFFPDLSEKKWKSLNGKTSTIMGMMRKFGGVEGIDEAIVSAKAYYDERAMKQSRWENSRINMAKNNYYEFNYEAYLKSDYWLELRQRVIERDGGRCKLCNGGGCLQAHHRSYKNCWYPEQEVNDLVTLCKGCHELFHNNSKLV